MVYKNKVFITCRWFQPISGEGALQRLILGKEWKHIGTYQQLETTNQHQPAVLWVLLVHTSLSVGQIITFSSHRLRSRASF